MVAIDDGDVEAVDSDEVHCETGRYWAAVNVAKSDMVIIVRIFIFKFTS